MKGERWIATTLSGRDRRSIGRVAEVVKAAMRQPSLVPSLVQALNHGDAVVRMRAADALEKLHHVVPDQISAFRAELLSLAENTTEQEMRWHLAQILPHTLLSKKERSELARVLERYFLDKSIIVRVSAMQALADLAKQDLAFRPGALRQVRAALSSGTPAEKARGRKLVQELHVDGGG